MMKFRTLSTICVLAAIWLIGGSASAQLAPDTSFVDRQNATLAEIATRYDGKKTYDNCVDFGFSTLGLVAQLELGERGLDGGIALADAEDDIAHMADEGIRVAATASSPCVWGEAHSPAPMHGLLGLGMLLHRYHDQLDAATIGKLETAAAGHWRTDIAPYLVNANISIVAGHLLAGERMGYDSEVWKDGVRDFEEIYDLTTKHGGLEMNAPIYTAYQFAALVPLLELEDDEMRQKARILLDYLFLVHAHLYLPGGGIGGPQSRDYTGGALDEQPNSLQRIAGLWTGDSTYEVSRNIHLIGAAVDYALPEALRSIYLDKGDGYEFWAFAPAPVASRTGRGYPFGEEGYPVAPWQAVVTPDAMFGVDHAFRYQSIHVSMGVYARTAPGTFPILYQYQPYIFGDTTETGGGLPSHGRDTEGDDFVRELYDFRRFVHGRSLISIWDPTTRNRDAEAVRQAPDTRVHIPDYSAYGGEMRTENTGGWFVGRAGDSYVAYYPLGTPSVGPERRSTIEGPTGRGTRDSEHYYLRLDGRSGGIVELATTDQFATIDDYVADLKTRHISFTTDDPITAEFDALDPDTGQKVRMRIEYVSEKRFLDGQELTVAEALDHGWLASPFLDYDEASRTMVLARDCYPRVTYDLANGVVTEEPATVPECFAAADSTVFSDVPYLGDFANYTAQNDQRWFVVDDNEDASERRLFLAPYEYVKDGDRLGELALVDARSYEDFDLQVDAKTHERISDNSAADYAIVFGYQDDSNYYFLLANARADYSELFALEDGVRRQLGVADTALIPDEAWHRLGVSRDGATITVQLDGVEVLSVDDETYAAGGIGLGSLNDSALFDNLSVVTPGAGGEDAGETADAGGQDVGTPPDAGSADAADASVDPDAQMTNMPAEQEGCSCDAAGAGHPVRGLALVVISTFIGVLLRRRYD